MQKKPRQKKNGRFSLGYKHYAEDRYTSLLYLSEDVMHQYMLKLHCIGGIGDDLT